MSRLEIVYGQSTIQNDCICYTLNQDKRSIECFILQAKKDSALKEYKHFKESATQKLELLKQSNDTKDKVIKEQKVKIKKKNKNLAKLTLVTLVTTAIAIFK